MEVDQVTGKVIIVSNGLQTGSQLLTPPASGDPGTSQTGQTPAQAQLAQGVGRGWIQVGPRASAQVGARVQAKHNAPALVPRIACASLLTPSAPRRPRA